MTPDAPDAAPDSAPDSAPDERSKQRAARRANRLRRRKRFFAVGIALGMGLGLAVLVWPHPSRRLTSRIVAATGLRDPDRDVLAKILARLPAGPATARIDAARRYVHVHSVHLIDAEHERYALDPPAILEKLVATAEDGAPPPHLSCGPRTFALAEILEATDIPHRVVALLGERDGALRTHTFLEVQNPDTGRWEVQDPDMDLVYVDRASGERLAAEALLFADLATVEAQGANRSGWQRLKDGYFQALLIDNTPIHERSRIVINAARTTQGFGERLSGRYGDAQVETRR